MTHLTVDVQAEQPYQVVIGRDASQLLPGYLAGCQRVAIVHAADLSDQLPGLVAGLDQEITYLEVPAGEQAKTGEVLLRCWERLAEAGFPRYDALVGFGGGAVTDLAGFVAATWLRGVRYVSVPTSILAMVDAAVGGKTGINLPAGKNLVGSFYEPFVVLCDLDYLTTLSTPERCSGLAEVIKAGFIADPFILGLVEDDPQAALDPSGEVLPVLIQRAVAVKAAVVSSDLRERTLVGGEVGREILNYGHTLGHAIERHEGFRWRHGEGVSVGMCFIAELSRRLGRLDEATALRHRRVLASVGLPTSYPAAAWPALRETMNLDKKTRGSSLRFVILDALARPTILSDPDEALLADTFAALESL